VGQTVAASLQAPTLFTIAEDLAKMQVDTSVAEADVGKLKPDMSATFLVDAYPQERFRGKVRQIRNSPQSVQNVVTYDAVIDVENPDLKLKPGMTANVTFVFAEKNDALRIPNAALRFRPSADLARAAASAGPSAPSAVSAAPSANLPASGTERRQGGGSREGAPQGGPRGSKEEPDIKTVWVLAGLEPRAARIRTGISDGTMTELTEGEVHEGDALITEVTGGEADTKAPSTTPPGGAAPGGGLRRVF
jgi:HlyD family secretion protein